MATIHSGRMTHAYAGDLVVFLIGMRVNKWWRPDVWLSSFLAMPPMLAELSKDSESGMLGYRLTVSPDGPLIVQYWNSVDKLYAYASSTDAEHRPAWTAFNRRARRVPGVVGVWHETFTVDRAESIYVTMPERGLARATRLVPVTRRLDRARDRFARDAS